jgi:hypothetical protein
MLVTLVVFLFIAASQAQETCDNPTVPGAPLETLKEWGPETLGGFYQAQRKNMKAGDSSFTEFDLIVEKPLKKTVEEMTKASADSANVLINKSLVGYDGLEVSYNSENIKCEPTYFVQLLWLKPAINGFKCNVKICLKAVDRRQQMTTSTKKGRGVSSLPEAKN